MKTLLTILLLLPLGLVAQFDQDTTPQYSLMIVCDNEQQFDSIENKIFNEITIFCNTKGLRWANTLQDSVSLVYGCEFPSYARLARIPVLAPAMPYINAIYLDSDMLEVNKAIFEMLDIPSDWKYILSKLEVVNRKRFKIVE